jgi:hypothetical protein
MMRARKAPDRGGIVNTYALQKIAAGYGEETRSAAATTTRARQARRERHAESRPHAAADLAGSGDLGGRGGRGGRGGFLADAVPQPRESVETVTRRAA